MKLARNCGVLLFVLSSNVSAQDIAVRLVDARSGRPLRKVPVTMFAWNGPASFPPDNVPKDQLVVHETSDKKGRVVFRLMPPAPAHVGFSVGTPWDYAGCWRLNSVSPEEVMRSGIVADYDESKCGKSKLQLSATPGEVLIVERKLTTGERIRRELP